MVVLYFNFHSYGIKKSSSKASSRPPSSPGPLTFAEKLKQKQHQPSLRTNTHTTEMIGHQSQIKGIFQSLL